MGRALCVAGLLWAAAASAQPLTADRAVQLALQNNTQVIQAEASVLDARGGLYGAMTGILPSVSASLTRGESRTTNETGSAQILGVVEALPPNDSESSSTTPSVSASWSGLRLSHWASLQSARRGVKAANLSRTATRAEVALIARRAFYEVVKAVKLEGVAEGAVRLARDDERRVQALFEVGSVSRSDLLKAQVRGAQSDLDLLGARHAEATTRQSLAGLLGMAEAELGPVDTVLVAEVRTIDEPALLVEVASVHPDLLAARAELAAARANRWSARLARLPYVFVQGNMQSNPKLHLSNTDLTSGVVGTGENETDRVLQGSIALRWDFFDGLASSSRDASANARLRRAEDGAVSIERNLAGDVHLAVLGYQKAVEQDKVARRGLESATENLKLTQEKYNVGSATILELIDAQVQLQRAQSDGVTALAAIRVAEAEINRVRGRAE